MSFTAHTETYKNYTIKIKNDDDGESPRNWDNLGTIVGWHKRYNIGDTNPFTTPKDFTKAVKDSTHIILPVYMYDHSGTTVSTTPFSCPWDSGQVGWIYVSKEDVRSEWGWKRLSAKRVKFIEGLLRGEVTTYDDYMTGNVFGYVVEDPDGEEIASCWGFYPDNSPSRILRGRNDYDGCLEEAKGEVDWSVENGKDFENAPSQMAMVI